MRIIKHQLRKVRITLLSQKPMVIPKRRDIRHRTELKTNKHNQFSPFPFRDYTE